MHACTQACTHTHILTMPNATFYDKNLLHDFDAGVCQNSCNLKIILLSCFSGLKLNLLSPDQIPQAAMTGGMVKEYSYTVLPTILPLVTVVITVLAMLVSTFDLHSDLNLLNLYL